MIEAVIFDMDGILFDSERIITTCWYQEAEERNIPREKMQIAVEGCIGLNLNDTKIFFHKMFGEKFDYSAFREKTAGKFYEEISKNGLPVMKGACEILSYLQTTSLKIGLASSSRTENIFKHIRAHDMEKYFEVIIGGDTIEHSKPEPDIYLKACKAIGVAPDRCLAIEDSPNGIRSAYAAGMLPIMVPDQVQPTEEIKNLLYRKFDSLIEVKKFIEREIVRRSDGNIQTGY